jgi:hypothetical protein
VSEKNALGTLLIVTFYVGVLVGMALCRMFM